MEDIKRRLFLTGAIGCGKSTAISRALGSRLYRCGGFLTRRRTEGGRKYFCLEKPDGSAGGDLSGCLRRLTHSKAAGVFRLRLITFGR